jgi:hypothetical protein
MFETCVELILNLSFFVTLHLHAQQKTIGQTLGYAGFAKFAKMLHHVVHENLWQ